MLRRATFCLLMIVTCSLGAAAQNPQGAAAPSAKSLAAQVDSHYNSLKTLRAEFSETYSGGGIRKTESGVLTLKRPGRMRWDYAAPAPKLFVTDGKTAYLYLPQEHQARRTPMKNVDDLRSPLRYLLGHSQLEKELADIQLAHAAPLGGSGNQVLAGAPRHLRDRVRQVLLEINPRRQIERISIEEIDGATTEFVFRNIEENRPMADGDFRFRPAPGVEVIDGKELETE